MVVGKVDLATLVSSLDTEIENSTTAYILQSLDGQDQQKANANELRKLAEKVESQANKSEDAAWSSNYISMVVTTSGSVLLGALIGDSVTKIWSKNRTQRR